MSLKSSRSPSPPPVLKNAPAAPVIVFDSVPAVGVNGSLIEMELGLRILMPRSDGVSVGADMLCVGHLRCSEAAARHLVETALRILNRAKTPDAADPGEEAA